MMLIELIDFINRFVRNTTVFAMMVLGMAFVLSLGGFTFVDSFSFWAISVIVCGITLTIMDIVENDFNSCYTFHKDV